MRTFRVFMYTLFWVFSVAFAVSLFVKPASPQTYQDSPTSQWFKSLTRPDVGGSCCDQSDCRQAKAELRDDGWWAVSNETKEWFKVPVSKITKDVSIFQSAILCEGKPIDGKPLVYCFVPPPVGF